MRMLLMYSTLPSQKEAQRVIDELVRRKVIACGVQMTGESAYEWKGEMLGEKEALVLFKTLPEKKQEASQALAELHPYDVPLVASWEVDCNESYHAWLQEQLA